MLIGQRSSRRDFLRTTAGTIAGLAALGPAALAEAASRYSGKFVVVDDEYSAQGWPDLLAQYQKLRPNLDVQRNSLSPLDQFPALFTAAQASGEQMDVLALNGLHLRRYAFAGDLLPLEHKVSYLSRFFPAAVDESTVGGHIWGLPGTNGGGFLPFYNNALLTKAGLTPPRSYADLLHIRDVLAKQGVSVFTHPGKTIIYWGVWFFMLYSQTSGNKSIENTIATLQGHHKFTAPDVVEALQLLFKFGKDKLFSPGLNSLNEAGALAEFLTGKAAFYFWYDSAILLPVRQQKPPNMDLKVMELPRLVANPSVRSQFPGNLANPVCIYSKIAAERLPVALDFLNFITSDASEALMVEATKASLGPNIRGKGNTDPLVLQELKFANDVKLYLDWFWPPEVAQAFNEGMQAGVTGNMTAIQVAQSVQAAYDGLVRKGYKFK